MMISGFTFVHNALEGGYPIFEAIKVVHPYVDELIIVDMASDDGTRELLEKMKYIKLLTSSWHREAHLEAWKLRWHCQGDVTIFFEADEVYDPYLLHQVCQEIQQGNYNLAVYRLQLEQNFQRCKWYPVPVHRIFPTRQGSYHEHPTHCPDYVKIIPPEHGFMWDISGCFRDNQAARKANQAVLFGAPRHLLVPEHFTQAYELSPDEEISRLQEPHWTWTRTPFAIPDVLKPLVGKTRYEPTC